MQKQLELPVYLFHQGTTVKAYELMGAHFETRDGVSGCVFRTWAPHTQSVSVIGDFNSWDETDAPMERLTKEGLWELFYPNVKEFDHYKYLIEDGEGKKRAKTDPYGFHMETRPGTASKVYSLDHHKWQDASWIKKRGDSSPFDKALNIYEVHLGSWRRYPDGNPFCYRKLASELIPYALELGYTHLELMPITEYPYDGSWGYQVSGYYAPTSRYGSPEDFMYFVDECHKAGLGVILDWVPGHFPKDEDGLISFDGEPCYEYSDPDKGQHKEWGTVIFDWGRNEVRSFLLSNALFWIEKYHVDGLRVDAVASMLYLDYGRTKGNWGPNTFGGRENLEAVALLRDLNKAVFEAYPNILMIAEESTSWPLVTAPVDAGGLGFNFKWNMGWMNDTLDYMKTDPIHRKGKHQKLTFPLTYAFSENYILPLSHDEVVHRKGSLLNKMPGSYEEKFAGLRAYYAYKMAHPGKKLLFMGGEIGQFSEWNFRVEIDWNLLEYEMHCKLRDFVKTLNHFYKDCPALWEADKDWSGFEWIFADDENHNILSFVRKGRGDERLIIVCNFAPVFRENYLLGVSEPGEYSIVLNSDDCCFGGSGIEQNIKMAERKTAFGYEYSLKVDLPPLATLYLKRR